MRSWGANEADAVPQCEGDVRLRSEWLTEGEWAGACKGVQGSAAQVWSGHGRAGAEEANSARRWAQRRKALKRVGQRGARQGEAQQVAARQGWTRSGRVGEDCRPGPGAASGWAAAQQKTRRLASATAEARRPSPRREAKRAKQVFGGSGQRKQRAQRPKRAGRGRPG